MRTDFIDLIQKVYEPDNIQNLLLGVDLTSQVQIPLGPDLASKRIRFTNIKSLLEIFEKNGFKWVQKQ